MKHPLHRAMCGAVYEPYEQLPKAVSTSQTRPRATHTLKVLEP